jgi:hypothetical protein
VSTDESWELAAGLVRPYVLTQGRTRPAHRTLAVEAMVCATPAGRQRMADLTLERRRIVELCGVAQSVAEVASKLGTPLVVARVLVGDLVEAGLLEAFEGATDLVADVELLQRLIARVKAIPA